MLICSNGSGSDTRRKGGGVSRRPVGVASGAARMMASVGSVASCGRSHVGGRPRVSGVGLVAIRTMMCAGFGPMENSRGVVGRTSGVGSAMSGEGRGAVGSEKGAAAGMR